MSQQIRRPSLQDRLEDIDNKHLPLEASKIKALSPQTKEKYQNIRHQIMMKQNRQFRCKCYLEKYKSQYTNAYDASQNCTLQGMRMRYVQSVRKINEIIESYSLDRQLSKFKTQVKIKLHCNIDQKSDLLVQALIATRDYFNAIKEVYEQQFIKPSFLKKKNKKNSIKTYPITKKEKVLANIMRTNSKLDNFLIRSQK